MTVNANLIAKRVTEIKNGIMVRILVPIGTSRYLKGIVDDWVIMCDEFIRATDSVSTNRDKYYISKCHEYCVNKL